MKSRYDYMVESKHRDAKTNELYPDCLSIDYKIESLTSMPVSYTLGKADLDKFWKWYYEKTNKTEGDDMLLSFNGVDYLGELEIGDDLYMLTNLTPNKMVIPTRMAED